MIRIVGTYNSGEKEEIDCIEESTTTEYSKEALYLINEYRIAYGAGWMLWFAYTVACGLYALGFAGYFVVRYNSIIGIHHVAKGFTRASNTQKCLIAFIIHNALD